MSVSKRFRTPHDSGRQVAILCKETGATLFMAELQKDADAEPPARRMGIALELALHAEADLTGADLRGVIAQDLQSFEGKLARADFTGADLSNLEFIGCDVRQTCFAGASLAKADFRACDLRGADLTGADIRHAQFQFCNARGALFVNPLADQTFFGPRNFTTPHSVGASRGRLSSRTAIIPNPTQGKTERL